MQDRKLARYERLLNQLKPLLAESPGFYSRLATINAVLYHKISYIFWVGFYLLENDRLVVNAYQGPLACQELEYPKGVCWHSIKQKAAVTVPDVSKFEGHIACDSRSKSELVVPLFHGDEIIGVIDADSDQLNAFDKADEIGIKRILSLVLKD